MKKPTLKQLLTARKARTDEIARIRREVRAIDKEINKKL